MKLLVSHPTGNRNVRAIMEGLYKAEMLAAAHSTIITDPANPIIKILPNFIRSELLRRTYPVPSRFLHSHPGLEIARMLLSKMGLKKFTSRENAWASVDSVYRKFDKTVSRTLASAVKNSNANAVYAYEDGAFETFTQAKKLGMRCIYDLPIAYWQTCRQLMIEEAERWPDWAVTFGGGNVDSPEKLERKTQELQLADYVVTPGSFVKDSLPGWSAKKNVIVSPFGSPENVSGLQNGIEKKNHSQPLRVLFAGSMSQRKGLADLLEAVKLLKTNNIELVVMGSLMAPLEFYKNKVAFTYEPGRPNAQVLTLMHSCHVFCLPSIVEGRALVMQEAMSQGLPLIITTHTGGADLIVEGKTGFLVPIRSPQAIAEKLEWFLVNRRQIPDMSRNSIDRAALYTWPNYAAGIINKLTEFQ